MYHYNRVTELFKEYCAKVTGTTESDSNRLFDFIYMHRPNYQTEILDFIYCRAFEDGMKHAMQTRVVEA